MNIKKIDPTWNIADNTRDTIDSAIFLVSSMILKYVENWTMDDLLRRTEEAVTYGIKRGLPVMYVTEDTTRAFPETIKRLYTTAINCGARHIVLTDTVGHATPAGVRALMRYVVDEVVRPSGE